MGTLVVEHKDQLSRVGFGWFDVLLGLQGRRIVVADVATEEKADLLDDFVSTRTGRRVLQARLKALTAKHGIAIAEVPSPWTSCECSGCGYTAKTNRKGSLFGCGFCGLTLHADVDAARVVLSRRSRRTPEHTGPRSRKNTLQLLDSQHRKRWRLPAAGAVPGIAGALGQSA
jgi:putative transposase